MYRDEILLTPKDILEKEFKIDARGYRMQEVDKFLDIIIRDYQVFYKIIKTLEEKNEKFRERLEELEEDIKEISKRLEMSQKVGDQEEVSSLDILKRISRLEEEIYSKK
jgi:DivIVA domain-containing protein